jgi:hypothetical protein
MLSLVGKTPGQTIRDVDGRPGWTEKPRCGMHHLARQAVFPARTKVFCDHNHCLPPSSRLSSGRNARESRRLPGTAILVIFLVMSSKGMPTSIGVEAFIVIIILVSLVLSVLFLREVK